MAFAEYSYNTSHHISIENTKLIMNEDHYIKRKTSEAIKIENEDNTLNKDDAIKLSNTWKLIINQVKNNNAWLFLNES